ncbi:unnamed protein product, partial [Laminaria digitata]
LPKPGICSYIAEFVFENRRGLHQPQYTDSRLSYCPGNDMPYVCMLLIALALILPQTLLSRCCCARGDAINPTVRITAAFRVMLLIKSYDTAAVRTTPRILF